MKLIVEERGRQVTYEIDAGEPAVIGRGLENTIPIRDSSASRKHCQVTVTPDGARVEDLGSKNGTLLNGTPLREAVILKPGDCVAIGEIKVWFEERRRSGAPCPPDMPSKRRREGEAPEEGESAPEAGPGPAADRPATHAPKAPPEGGEPAAEPSPGGGEAAPGGRFALEVVGGAAVGKRFPIEKFPFKVGRTKRNALQVHDAGISGEHFEIIARGDGCAIVDLGSTNGTKVNGVKVKRAVLADGARINVGGLALIFRDASRPAGEAQRPTPPSGQAAVAAPKPAPRSGRPPVAAPAAPKAAAAPRAPRSKAPPSPGESAGRPGSGRAAAPGPAVPDAPAAVLLPDSGFAASVEDAAPAPAPAPALAPASALAPAGADALGGAADGLGRTAAAVVIEGAGGHGVLAVGLIGAAVLLAAGLFAAAAFRHGAPPAPGEVDPPPRGNRVANWSFEEDPGPDGVPPRWKVVAGKVAIDAIAPAGGLRAARLTPAPGGLVEIRSVADLPAGGRDVQVRGLVRGGPAALAVIWESTADPTFRLISTTDLVTSRGGFSDLRGTFRPPPGADRARLALVAAGEASFDRVSIVEREASTAGFAAARIEAGGLAARLDERGLFDVWRDGWPVFDRGGLALLGPGPLEPLARQEAAAEIASALSRPPSPKKAERRGRAAAAPAPARVGGSIIAPAGGARVGFVEEVSGAAGRIDCRYRLPEPVAGVAPAIVLYIEQRSRAGLFELTAAASRQVTRREAPFDESGIDELTLGAGGDAVSLRLDPPLAARAAPCGAGLLLTLAADPGAAEVGFSLGRGSSREKDLARMLFDEADAEKRAGRLEESRRIYATIAREFAHDAASRERARRAEQAIVARAEAALSEAAAIEGDIAEFRVATLLESAEARCRFVIEAFPETSSAAKAADLLSRIGRRRSQVVGESRVARARELRALGRKHLDEGHYHLARLYLRMVTEGFPDVEDVAREAAREAELAERHMERGPR